MDFKNTLRKEITHNLKALENKDILSKKIADNLQTLALWEKCNKLYIFISFKDEVLTKYIINLAKAKNIKIYAPLINKNIMNFYRIDNLDESDLIKNKLGILEPPLGLEESLPDKNSIFIIPGLAFSKKMERMGRGGGFYDRYLKTNSVLNKIAIAYEIQIKEQIPTDEWDQKVDFIVTENNIYGEENGN